MNNYQRVPSINQTKRTRTRTRAASLKRKSKTNQVDQRERKAKIKEMMKMNRNQVMMRCHTVSGKHGGRSRNWKQKRRNLAPSDDLDSDQKRRSFHTSSKNNSSKEKGKAEYHRVSHDYTFQLPSDHSASIHMGKPPYFDGTGYNQWKTKMFGYLNAIHRDLWKVVEVGCEIPDEDETPTPLQQYVLQKNSNHLIFFTLP